MKQILAVILCAALLSACIVSPAADYADYSDTAGHWAADYIRRVTEAGLFQGVSSTQFAPNGTMTRAMFVTVLGRLAGIQPSDWKLDYGQKLFTDVKPGSYYAPYVNWAVLHGITNGTGQQTFSPNRPITREQLACFVASFLENEDYAVGSTAAYSIVYSDQSKISSWALDSVKYLSGAGILTGKSDGAGGLKFAPKSHATRAECATVFCRILDQLKAPAQRTEPSSIALSLLVMTLQVGSSQRLYARILPANATNKTVSWYSTDSKVASVDLQGKVTGHTKGVAVIYGVSSNRLKAMCTVTVEAAGDDSGNQNLANGNMSRSEKLMMIYGTTNISEPRTVYTSESEAQSHQASFPVQTWDLDSSGNKITRTRYLTVHVNLASTVKAIFDEIYALPEKPLIHEAGGWRWRSYEKSEHNMGLAIDINPTENPYVPKGYDPYSFGFKPGENPYSIPIGGSIDKIFNKYGFIRGIYWNNGNKDFMHYSFFGT